MGGAGPQPPRAPSTHPPPGPAICWGCPSRPSWCPAAWRGEAPPPASHWPRPLRPIGPAPGALSSPLAAWAGGVCMLIGRGYWIPTRWLASGTRSPCTDWLGRRGIPCTDWLRVWDSCVLIGQEHQSPLWWLAGGTRFTCTNWLGKGGGGFLCAHWLGVVDSCALIGQEYHFLVH